MLRMRLIFIDQKRRLILIASELGMSSSVYCSTGRGLISLVDTFFVLFTPIYLLLVMFMYTLLLSSSRRCLGSYSCGWYRDMILAGLINAGNLSRHEQSSELSRLSSLIFLQAPSTENASRQNHREAIFILINTPSTTSSTDIIISSCIPTSSTSVSKGYF